VRRPRSGTQVVPQELIRLLYELLDAHLDTVELAAPLAEAELAEAGLAEAGLAEAGLGAPLATRRSWRAHLDYLRALQRTGREMLARVHVEALS
jgi:hypothetical protein